MDDIAMSFLRAYAAGSEVDGGWKYAKALRQSRLDYSQDSLARLDHLLRQVRERAQPTRADLDSVKGRNFASLIAFYAVELVRRRTGADLVWHDRESALGVLPAGVALPQAPFARLMVNAMDQCVAFWPLAWVGAQLLPEGERASAAAFIDDLVAQIERDAPPAWWQAAQALGRLASWQMMTAAGGGPVLPTMSSPNALDAPGGRVGLVSAAAAGEGDGVERALQDGARRLEDNPEGARWQVLSYDGVLAPQEPRGERLDAVIAIAHTYGDRPLRIKVAFPYRPARDGRPLAILQPVLRQANVPGEKVALLDAALQRGIQAVAWPAGMSWDALRREGA